MVFTRILVCFSVCFFTLNSFGQDALKLSDKVKKNSIIFSPFNLIDPINPSFQVGYL